MWAFVLVVARASKVLSTLEPDQLKYSDIMDAVFHERPPKKKQRVEFYGNDGHCLNCKQPMEGQSCPYCGWEDDRPAQYEYR